MSSILFRQACAIGNVFPIAHAPMKSNCTNYILEDMYMMNEQNPKDKNEHNQKSEKQLSNINQFFSAFGNFLNGIFCISQYFLTGKPLFGYITLGIIVIIGMATYGISYSKVSLKNDKLWAYITQCANRLGPLNPVFLLLSIIFTLNASIETIMIWIIIELLQLCLYAFEFRKKFPYFGSVLIHKTGNWARSNIALIITFLLAVVFGWLWYISPENNRYADLWLNLSAGFIASAITISVIDRILKKQKETNERPLRQAMYRDIQLFTSRFIQMWQEMYLHSVEIRTNMTVEEFFEPSSIEMIRNSLDLSCMANVYPEQTWFSYIENARIDLKSRGQKILTTYSNIAEPEVLQSIHYLIYDSAYLGCLNIVAQTHAYDVHNHIPRPTLLAYYTLKPKELDSKMASKLFTWCHTQYKKLQENSKGTTVIVMPISAQLHFQDSDTKVTSAITIEKLNRMENEFRNWQQSKKNHTTNA